MCGLISLATQNLVVKLNTKHAKDDNEQALEICILHVTLLVTLITIMTHRKSSRAVATMNKVHHHSPRRLSPLLAHFLPHLPDTPPPPDESTTYESVLTTSTPTDITDFDHDVTIVVRDVRGDDTAVEDNTEDDSLT